MTSANVDYDSFCRRCKFYDFNLSKGILCGITKLKPDFEDICSNFSLDPERDKKLKVKNEWEAHRERSHFQDKGFFAPEKKGISMGVVGGIIMIVIAVVWFFAGLAAGLIFFYPPILFLIGLFALITGLFKGNYD